MPFPVRLSSVLASLPLCCSTHQHHLRSSSGLIAGRTRSGSPPVVVELQNVEDMFVSATVQLGNKPVQCLMDSGSSEQVIFSSRCPNCGSTTYNCDEDEGCTWGDHEGVQCYGSGDTESTEAHVRLTVASTAGAHNITVREQMVWLATRSYLDVPADSVQCIFGLGPARSPLKLAQLELQRLRSRMDPGGLDAAAWAPTLRHIKKHIQFMEGVTLWQESAGISTMSFCLHPGLSKNGQLVFNDDYPEIVPGAFVRVPAKGLFWQVDATNIGIHGKHQTMSACSGGARSCTAIMDTGTTLIGAPREFVRDLSDMLVDMVPRYGCKPDLLGRYPDLSFELGGHHFALPARSYLCEFLHSDWESLAATLGDVEIADLDEDDGKRRSPILGERQFWRVQRRMRHVHRFKRASDMYQLRTRPGLMQNRSTADAQFFCAPCFFEHEVQNDDTEEWIFGLPFFREYYTTFRANAEHTAAHDILFAKHAPACIPQEAPSGARPEFFHQLGVRRVTARKVRLPPSRRTDGLRLARM